MPEGPEIRESTITIRPPRKTLGGDPAPSPDRDLAPVAAEVSALLDQLGAQGIRVEKSEEGALIVTDDRRSLIPADAREILGTSAAATDPSLVTLRQVELLVRDPEALSELSDREIVGLAALDAMHSIGMLQIPGTMKFTSRLITLRQAKDRRRVNEFISALTGGKINLDLLNSLMRQNSGRAGNNDDPAAATAAPKRSIWQRVTGRGA